MPASKPAPSSATRGTLPAANPAAGTSNVRLLWLALAGIALAAAAWWFRSSDWLRERILSGADLPALEAAARRQPDDPLVAYALAKRYYIERRFGEAATAYEQAARLAPHSARAHLGLGLSLYEVGRMREATGELGEALRIDPHLAWPEYMLGKIAWLGGRTNDALPHVARATQLDPRSDPAWYALGICYLQLHRYAEAVDAFRKALAHRDANAHYHTALAEVLVYRGQTDEGRQHYERALQLDPNYGPACALMGNFYLRKVPGLDAQDRAEALLLRATKLKTYHPEQVYLDLGDLYLQKGEYRKAAAALQASIRSDPRDERPYYALAKAYRALGQAQAAAAAQSRFQRISKLHVRMEEREAQVFHSPANAPARLDLARLYRSIGMVPQSAEQYAAYLRLNPSDAIAAREFQQLAGQAVPRPPDGTSDFALPPLH